MLYGYPPKSVIENWFHDCLESIVDDIHLSVSAGRLPTPWPNCIPARYRKQLQGRSGLRARIDKYVIAFTTLNPIEKAKVIDALQSQNKIVELLSGTKNCTKISDLDRRIRKAISDLYSFGFSLLGELGVRDRQYRIIWKNCPNHICPFCGMEIFDSPNAPREDDDHFLARSIYPFAGVNLRNLVPMGGKCNRKYKRSVNILYTSAGLRRPIFDPYHHTAISISLDRTEPFTGTRIKPQWIIDFVPAQRECETWDEIFKVRTRYCRDILDPQFMEWLRRFRIWWKQESHERHLTKDALVNNLNRYINQLRAMELTGHEFLRVPVFQMLLRHCNNGNGRLISFLNKLVGNL